MLIKWMAQPVYKSFKLAIFKNRWRKKNKNNFTVPENVFDMKYVSVGKGTYGPLRIRDFGSQTEMIEIGCYCSISPDVTFILGGEHNYKNLLSYPFNSIYGESDEKLLRKGPIIIGDDVWFGSGVTVLSGVTIGKGAVIASGTTVRSDVPPYSIYGQQGVIRYRFSEEIIQQVLDIDFNALEPSVIKELLNEPIEKAILFFG